MPSALEIQDVTSVWNFTEFLRVIFAEAYLREFLVGFRKSEIEYKIEAVDIIVLNIQMMNKRFLFKNYKVKK